MPGGQTMQAIYEGCYEYTKIQGIYVSRGDPAAFDFTVATLTADDNWHDMDLSGIVPEHAKGVILLTRLNATVINNSIRFRQKGNVNDILVARSQTQVANVPLWNTDSANLDTNRHIQYNAAAGNWTSLDVVVCAWIF